MPLYVHIPFCSKKCGYCDFFSEPSPRNQNFFCDYVFALLNQINFFATLFGIKEFTSLYIGGGTPSLLSARQIECLLLGIKCASPFSKNCEITMEANPESVSKEFLQAAQNCGANRLSLGMQCSNDKVLKTAGRAARKNQIFFAIETIQKFWKGAWCADLIAGLPFQTWKMLKNDIDFALQNKASHISLYSLSLEKGTELEKKIAKNEICFEQDKADLLWIFGRNYLEEKNFFQYEVSNFAKKGFESVHNFSYWKLQNYLGAGAGATGSVFGYGKKTSFRFFNTRDIKKYIQFWKNFSFEKKIILQNDALKNECLSKSEFSFQKFFVPKCAIDFFSEKKFPYKIEMFDTKTEEFEYLMMGFRTLRGVSKNEYRARFGGDLQKRLGANNKNGVFFRWQKKGLACITEKNCDKFFSLTRNGILFLNKFLEEAL